MPKFVRVKLTNGAEASVTEQFAQARNLNVLKKPATNRNGRPLPAKHNPLREASSEPSGAKKSSATEKEK